MLHNPRHTLTEEHGGSWVVCHSCYSTTAFSDEIRSMLSPHSGGLNREVDVRNNVGILLRLLFFSHRRRWPRLDTAGLDVRLNEGFRTGSIPGEAPTPLPCMAPASRHLTACCLSCTRNAVPCYYYYYYYYYSIYWKILNTQTITMNWV